MTTLEALKRGRDRIAQGKCEDAFARNKDGIKTSPHAADACSWCARGALWIEGGLEATALLIGTIGARDVGDLFRFSDSHTQAEVLAAFDKTIALCEAAL